MYYGSEGKKLKDAAGHMFGSVDKEVSPEFIADLKAKGAPRHVIKDYEARARKENDFIVHFDNWDAVRLFNSCRTQWRRAGLNGARVGLDYVAVEIVAKAKKIGVSEETFGGVQVMEAESLRIFNA